MVTLTPSGRGTIVVNLAMLAVSSVGVALRMLAKRRLRQPLALEDGLIFLSLMAFAACVAVTLYAMVNAGGTMEYSNMTLQGINDMLKV